jgi:hypothetical protein
MNPTTARRFDTEFAPRIARTIADLLGPCARVDVIPYGGADQPTTVTVVGPDTTRHRAYAHPLNLRLTRDADEIASLLAPHGPGRFSRYLTALPRKLTAWQDARSIDLATLSQADALVLLGNLDFES